MNILPTISRESICFLENHFLRSLNFSRNVISAIALMAFSCLAAGYALYYCCFNKKAKKLEPLKEPKNLPQVSVEAQQNYDKGIKTFSFEIFQHMIAKSKTENQLVSPLGISLLLSMIKHGVSVEDQKEIEHILHLPQDENELKVNAYQLIKKLQARGLDLAGLLYLNGKYRLNPHYQDLTSRYYQSKVDIGSSAKEVNAWVKQATKGQIQDIISQGDLDDFFLVLANAIHFKGEWTNLFKAEDTHSANFSTPTETIRTPMMHQVNHFEYFEDEKCQAVRLHYSDKKEFSMLLLLPKQDNDFSFVDASYFEKISKRMATEMVKLAVPKFKMEQEIDVKQMLAEKGVQRLFGKPDFSPLADLTHPPTKEVLPQLYISKTTQKSALVCDEKGTEASSVSVAIITKECCVMPPKHSKEVNFNRPFLAALVSEETPVLFGVVRKPSS